MQSTQHPAEIYYSTEKYQKQIVLLSKTSTRVFAYEKHKPEKGIPRTETEIN